MSSTTPTCEACGCPVRRGDGLLVENVRTGRRFIVHRPTVRTFDGEPGRCFRRIVGDVWTHRIAELPMV